MNREPQLSSGSIPAGDHAMRHQCERLQRLTGDLLVADRNDVIRRMGELRSGIESLMSAHHRQEETILFPALIESMAGSDPVCLRELTGTLTAEHRYFENTWERVCSDGDPEALRAFAEGYLRHIEREEQELLPMAARLLTEDELAGLIR